MTELLNSGILAFIQGATEFLPISSSAHLIILPHIFGWRDQGLAFDIAVHVGTLLASLTYFRVDILKILQAWFKSITGHGTSLDAKTGWFIIIASIPVAVTGALIYELVESGLRSPTVIGISTLVFALLLWYADRFRRGQRTLDTMRWTDAVMVGLAQAIALVPGASRSGITITAGLMLGMTRKEAARFAFLLAIPAISMAGGWQFLKLLDSQVPTDWVLFTFAMAISALVAYLCIHYFLEFIEKIGMLPFVLYRLVLALAIFALI